MMADDAEKRELAEGEMPVHGHQTVPGNKVFAGDTLVPPTSAAQFDEKYSLARIAHALEMIALRLAGIEEHLQSISMDLRSRPR